MDPHFYIWSESAWVYFPFMGLGDFLAYELGNSVFVQQSRFQSVPNRDGATMQVGAVLGQPGQLLFEV